MRRRSGFSLIEVLLASAVLATSMVTVFGLIAWSRRVGQESVTRALAQTVAADTMARLSGEPFEKLEKRFGPGSFGKVDPTQDPVLKRAITYMAGETGMRALDVRADFRLLPAGPGYLQVAVSFPTRGDERASVVVSRLLPTPALSSYSLESGPHSLVKRANAPLAAAAADTPVTRANDGLFFSLLQRTATSSVARFLDLAMSADRRDHKYDLDWTRVVDVRLEEDAQWRALMDKLDGADVPDGVYDVTEDALDLRGKGAGRATLYTLRDMSDHEHFLVRRDAPGGGTTLGRAAARDVGALPIIGLWRDELVAPREPSSAQVLATAHRVFIAHDRFDAGGRLIPFAPRMGVFTAPETMDPFAVSGSFTTFLFKAVRMAGLSTEPRRVAPVKSAPDDAW